MTIPFAADASTPPNKTFTSSEVEFGFISVVGSLRCLSSLVSTADAGGFAHEDLGWLIGLVEEKAEALRDRVLNETHDLEMSLFRATRQN